MRLSTHLISVVQQINEENDPKFSDNVLSIANKLKSHGFQALVVGGTVRDSLLGVVPKDVDIATDASPDEVESLFDKTIPLGKSFGVIVVVMPDGEQYEIATFRSDGKYSDGRRPEGVNFEKSPKEDASRRDFTINSMFIDPITHELHDYFGGKQDIENKLVRTVGSAKDRFNEDKLRMLRAIRFSVKLGFDLTNEVKEAIKEQAEGITKVSGERIRAEIVKMLSSDSPDRAVRLLDETGLLQYVLPEVSSLKGVNQSPDHHPEGDAFEHTVLVVKGLTRKPYITVLAGLLHDTGKAKTYSFNAEKNKIQFLKHEEDSAILAEQAMRRLKFTRDEIKEVVFLVSNHMKMGKFDELKLYKQRMLAGEKYFDSLVDLTVADHESTGASASELLKDVYRIKAMPKEEPLITSRDLMDLGIKSGEIYSKIFNAVMKSQLDGKTKTKEQAINIAKSIYNQSK